MKEMSIRPTVVQRHGALVDTVPGGGILYLSVGEAREQLIPALIDVVHISQQSISGLWRLSAQYGRQVIQQFNVAVVVVRLHLQHLQSTLNHYLHL